MDLAYRLKRLTYLLFHMAVLYYYINKLKFKKAGFM